MSPMSWSMPSFVVLAFDSLFAGAGLDVQAPFAGDLGCCGFEGWTARKVGA